MKFVKSNGNPQPKVQNKPLKSQSQLQQTTFINIVSLFFRESEDLIFHKNPLLRKIKVKKIQVPSAAIFIWHLKSYR